MWLRAGRVYWAKTHCNPVCAFTDKSRQWVAQGDNTVPVYVVLRHLQNPFSSTIVLKLLVRSGAWVGGGISILGRRMQDQQAAVVTCLRFYSQKRSWSRIQLRYSASISSAFSVCQAVPYAAVWWCCPFNFFKLKYSWFTVLCQSAVQHSDSIIHI